MPQAHGDVDARHELPEAPLVDPGLAPDALVREPEPLEPPVEVEAGRGRPDEQERRLGMARARTSANARRSSGIRLLALTTPKQPMTGPAATRAARTSGTGQAGCGTTQIGPS